MTKDRSDKTHHTTRMVEDDGTLKRGQEAVSTKKLEVETAPPPPPPPPPSGEE